jgi:hypothetical protein
MAAPAGGRPSLRRPPLAIGYQDSDGGIRYLSFTQTGGGDNVQFIGLLDELAIYDRALTETEVRQHYRSVFEETPMATACRTPLSGNGLNRTSTMPVKTPTTTVPPTSRSFSGIPIRRTLTPTVTVRRMVSRPALVSG